MIRKTVFSLIQIGLWLRHLQNPEGLSLASVRKGCNLIIRALDNMGFTVSLHAKNDLVEFINERSASPDSDILSGDDVKDLSRIIFALEKVITPEAKSRHYFIVADQRYNTKYLLESPDKLFHDGVFERLPELTQTDFREGFNCIVFGRATATAFRILRGTEGALKSLYFAIVKRNRVKNAMWASMTQHLRGRTRNPVPEVLLESLDMIRKSYRNPTAHPEAIYTVQQAEDLIGVCIDVVNKMDAVLAGQ